MTEERHMIDQDQLDEYIEKLQHPIKLMEHLHRLQDNPDFKALINEEYLREEAIRAVMLKGDPEMQTVERQSDINNVITGIGNLRTFFNRVYRFGNNAIESVEEARRAVAEQYAEEAQE